MKDNLYNFWEEKYKASNEEIEIYPDNLVIDYIDYIPKGKVLDLGIGEDRNSLYLARKGFEVEGIDISDTLISRLKSINNQQNLGMKLRTADIRNINIDVDKYTFILATAVLHYFRKIDAEEILNKMKKGINKDGFVYVSVFSIEDSSYSGQIKSGEAEQVGNGEIFIKKDGIYRSYYSKEELLAHFEGFEMVSFINSRFLHLSHSEPHYHSEIIYLGRKR